MPPFSHRFARLKAKLNMKVLGHNMVISVNSVLQMGPY